MEWKSSADKERYGDMIGEVIHHTLFEDGTITKYDVKFGNKTIKNIPTAMLEVVKMQEHKHEADDGDDELDENWFADLSAAAKKAYLKLNPNSKYAGKGKKLKYDKGYDPETGAPILKKGKKHKFIN